MFQTDASPFMRVISLYEITFSLIYWLWDTPLAKKLLQKIENQFFTILKFWLHLKKIVNPKHRCYMTILVNLGEIDGMVMQY